MSRERPMIAPALGEQRKLRIVVRILSVLLRAGATGVGRSLGALFGCRGTRFIISCSRRLCRSTRLPSSVLYPSKIFGG